MSLPVEHQLRAYFEDVDRQQGVAPMTDTLTSEPHSGDDAPVDLDRARRSRNRRRTVAAVVAAAVAVAALAIGVLVLVDGSGRSVDVIPADESDGVDSSVTTVDDNVTTVEEEPTPTSAAVSSDDESFEGQWSIEAIEAEFRDGAYELTQDGRVVDQGQFRVQLGQLVLVSDAQSERCAEGDTGVWDYAVADPDTITLLYVSDDCDTDRGLNLSGPDTTLVRVQPG